MPSIAILTTVSTACAACTLGPLHAVRSENSAASLVKSLRLWPRPHRQWRSNNTSGPTKRAYYSRHAAQQRCAERHAPATPTQGSGVPMPATRCRAGTDRSTAAGSALLQASLRHHVATHACAYHNPEQPRVVHRHGQRARLGRQASVQNAHNPYEPSTSSDSLCPHVLGNICGTLTSCTAPHL